MVSDAEEAGRTAGGRAGQPLRASMRRWLTANTFAPRWLTGRWRHPAIGYLAAAGVELLALAAVVLLVQAIPHFQFPEALLLLALVLVALTWGAGPALFATVVGVILLDLLIVPPIFSLALTHVEDAWGVGLMLVVGVILSLVAGQTERTRREAMGLARTLAGERTRLAEAERAATAQANELQAIFDAMTDGVAVYDGDARLVRTNATFRATFAFEDRPGLAALPVDERIVLFAPRDAAGLPLTPEQAAPLRLLRGEVLTGERAVDLLIRVPDGSDRHISLAGAPVRDAEGRIVRAVAVARDVTERRRLEQRTREALDALLALAETLFGPTTPEEDTASAPATAAQVAALTRSVLGCERVGITAVDPETGALHPLAGAGLAPEEERYWRAWDGTPLGTQMGDPGIAERLLEGGVTLIDMTRPPFSDRYNPTGIPAFLVAPMRAGERLAGLLSVDYGNAPHSYTDDEIALVGAIARLAAAAVERERLRREREEARAVELALRETNRRMDEFLSIAAHELRSPLTGIKGSTQLARRRLRSDQDTARIAELLERVEGQANRLSRLIDDLLDVSRIQSGHLDLRLGDADLAQMVRRGVEEQRVAWPTRDIELDVPECPIPVRADADRLAQVVGNYVTNALKYSPPDRPIAVTVEVCDQDACVSVRDHGAGLTPEQQRDVWDRYRRVQGVAVQDEAGGSGGGLGLGLYISRTIVEGHGGRVGVESAPGMGARFWFLLPLARHGEQAMRDDGTCDNGA